MSEVWVKLGTCVVCAWLVAEEDEDDGAKSMIWWSTARGGQDARTGLSIVLWVSDSLRSSLTGFVLEDWLDRCAG